MRHFVILFLTTVIISFFGAAPRLNASPIEISFLDDDAALQNTANLLGAIGCDSNSINLFQTAVQWNYKYPLGLELKAFPPRKNGFYQFLSISDLIAALPQPLITAAHPAQMNCFDSVILLAGSLMQTKVRPDALCGPFLTPVTLTNNIVNMVVEATARDAYIASHPAWFAETTKAVWGESQENQHICLLPAFDSYFILPHATNPSNLADNLLQVLQAEWKRQGIVFPSNIEIVICYSAVWNQDGPAFLAPFANATHAGLLFRDHDRYVYLEKAGASGPYVRLDFADKRDLLPWLKSLIEPTITERDHLFATFNRRESTHCESLDNLAN